MKVYKLYPRRAMVYNDRVMCCSSCHNKILYFAGCYKYIVCDKCGKIFRDKLYLANNVSYKEIKNGRLCNEQY